MLQTYLVYLLFQTKQIAIFISQKLVYRKKRKTWAKITSI